MYNTSNPAELYPNTTWELLPNDKFLKTGTTPLQQNGSNSVSISKTNLPADKLQVESHAMTRGAMDITGTFVSIQSIDKHTSGAFYPLKTGTVGDLGAGAVIGGEKIQFKASRAWTGSTSSASPYTTAMGNGTPITVNPEHITVKAWKRLS